MVHNAVPDARKNADIPLDVFVYAAAAKETPMFFSGNDEAGEGVGRAVLRRSRGDRSEAVSSDGCWLSHNGRILLVAIPAEASHASHAPHASHTSSHAHADATLLRREHTGQGKGRHRSRDERRGEEHAGR
jgi:hypothetical protein